ncbi:DUF2971 domain-containing protein [Chryseobacterium sediminis]|uniref:DUF2971 domain-containing protein n=1 Tax=Chryseobacterium sediminis TaxID=1679494 RepID=UPI00285CE08E|nr:DUF2971 domain-containing protein [Chryseobacterium sediminis]MDR6462676.1 hypothetical protein [Chryseobacterium sediminis]
MTIFYKFRNYSENTKARTLEIINKQELYFAGIESFNDPFDGRVRLRFDGKLNEVKAALIRTQFTMNLIKEEKLIGITIEQAEKLIEEKITDEFINDPSEHKRKLERIQKLHNEKGVLSLSTQNNNILMWSHYTENHKGVCFGFEFSEDAFSKTKRVRYQSHYDDIWAWLHTDEEVVDRILFSKSSDWQYEDEYRIIRESIGAEKFNPDSLKEIIFGSKMSENDRLEIIEECRKSGLNPTFKEATLDIERYKINISDYYH